MEEEIVEIEDDDPSYELFYFDNDEVRRGPYSKHDMHEWYERGYFSDEIQIEAHLDQVHRKTVGQLIAENGQSTPFSFEETISICYAKEKLTNVMSEMERLQGEKQNLLDSLERERKEHIEDENLWRRKFAEIECIMSTPKTDDFTVEITKLKEKIADINQQKTNCINNFNRQKEKWKEDKLKLQKENEDAALAKSREMELRKKEELNLETKRQSQQTQKLQSQINNLKTLLKKSENNVKQINGEIIRLQSEKAQQSGKPYREQEKIIEALKAEIRNLRVDAEKDKSRLVNSKMENKNKKLKLEKLLQDNQNLSDAAKRDAQNLACYKLELDRAREKLRNAALNSLHKSDLPERIFTVAQEAKLNNVDNFERELKKFHSLYDASERRLRVQEEEKKIQRLYIDYVEAEWMRDILTETCIHERYVEFHKARYVCGLGPSWEQFRAAKRREIESATPSSGKRFAFPSIWNTFF